MFITIVITRFVIVFDLLFTKNKFITVEISVLNLWTYYRKWRLGAYEKTVNVTGILTKI